MLQKTRELTVSNIDKNNVESDEAVLYCLPFGFGTMDISESNIEESTSETQG